MQLQLVVEDQWIKDIRFDGSGCTISQASASMMTDAVIGKTVSEALALADQFSLLVQGKDVPKLEELGDAALLNGVAKFPARIKCATLSWKALEKALSEKKPDEGKARSEA